MACGLLALGLRRAIASPSSRRQSTAWTLVQLAAARTGAVLVILDGDWSGEELALALARLRAARARDLHVGAGGAAALVAIAARQRGARRAHGRARTATREDLGWSELLVSGSAMDARLLVERDSLLEPTDCVAIEVRPGDVEGRPLTHRDYLGPAGTAPPAGS